MSDVTARIANLSPEKRALLERRRQQPPGKEFDQEPLAIVGMACRLPGGADSPEAFWQLLASGVDAISEVPADRWSVDEYYDPDPSAAGMVTTRWGGFLAEVDRFDASFFSISPREAAQMDPQQRLLLEVAWRALEHGGLAPRRLGGSRTGVFVGVHSHSADYCWMQFERPDALDGFSATGSAHNFLSGRLSYLLDLQGPSLVVDTACSSSLVATHLACQSLRAGECSMAIVGGVNLMLTPHFTIAASRMGMLSADGRCKPFAAAADGFTRGEGCGVVVIERLSDAIAAGDRVLALIRGSAINQDGHTNGITAPNGLSQQAVIRETLRCAGVEPHQVGYIETHGTGTPLGDPIEIEALASVFAAVPGSNHRVALGAAKSNIGHLEGAAGIAGLIKAVLSLQHRQFVPVVHFRTLNPHINLDGTPFVIPTSLDEWISAAAPRIAGVSSFGWSGTNAHLLLEEGPVPPLRERPSEPSRPYLVPLSAGSDESLKALVKDWNAWLARGGQNTPRLRHVAEAAALRRAHHRCRLAIAARSTDDLRAQLEAVADDKGQPAVFEESQADGHRSGVVFVFPGQGSQWLGMGRELLRTEPEFRKAIEACEQAIASHANWSLAEQLDGDLSRSRLAEIDVIQPTLFAIEVALAALWRSWGIEPDAVAGHSMGEVAAAHVAGVLTLEDAATVICRRSRLLKRVSGKGAMAVVELSVEEATAAIAGCENRLSIAVSNSPRSTVLSGDAEALDELLTALQEKNVFCRPVKVDVASHSFHVEPLKHDLLSELKSIRPSPARIAIHSTVTGQVTDGAAFTAEYWARNLREPVLFSTVVQRLAASGLTTFIEMSPHPILLPAVESILQHVGRRGLVLPSLRRDEPERLVMLGSLGRLYESGHEIDWARQTPGPPAFVELPSTPFTRERFWLGDPPSAQRTARPGHALLGRPVESAGHGLVWDVVTEDRDLPRFENCQLDGRPMLAPGVSIDAALEATRVVGTAVVSRLEFVLPLRPVPDSLTMHARAEARPESGGRFGFRLATRVGDGPWTAHLTATLAPTEEGDQLSDLDLDAVSRRCAEALTAADAYARLASCGWQIGGALRALGGVRVSADEALARFEFRRPHAEGRVQLDPRIGQACMDLVMLVAGAGEASLTRGLHLPLRVGRLRRHAAPTTSGWILVRRRMRGEEPILDAWVLDDGRGLIVSLIGIELTFLPADAREFLSRGLDDWLFELGWEALPASPSARTEPGAWVVLADRSGIGDELLRKLAAQGDLVVAVGRNQANPRDAIAGALESAGGRCRGVVHLWSLDLPGVDGVEPGELERSLLANNLGVLHAVRALARIESPHPPLLWIITRGAQAVQNPVGAQAPPQATVWGLGRVIAEEHPECWGGLVDLDPCVDAGTAANTLVERLQSNDGERQVACRSNVFFGARFAPLSRRADALSSIPLRPDATYLVTGGFGGVGLATARWMVTEGARRLVLIGRTPLPPRAQWKTADESTEIGRRIAAVRELEALGASVHLAALDIGDGEAVEGFWNAYHQEGWPPIRGVVHAAVVIEDGLLRDLDPESFATVARPKVCGGLALHRLANQVDFFTLFSSLGSMLGQAGQATYAAANAFLDALAHYRTGRGLPAISINWGGWREAGLGTASAGARLTIRNLESEGIASFTTAQGLQVFGRLLADNLPQAIVMPVSWSRFRSSHQAAHDSRLFAAVLQEFAATRTTSSPDQASFRSRLLETEPAARLNVLERFLTDQLAAVLRLPVSRVDPDRPMGSMGLESLLALELRNRLESRLGLRLSATIVWNYPTISGLAGYLAGLMDVTLDASGDVTPPVERGSEPVLPDASELDTMSELEALRALGAAREKA